MSDGNVINFPGDVTYVDLDPKEMVKNAMEDIPFKSVILVGWTDSETFTVCSSSGSVADIVYSLEFAKKTIIENANQ